MAPFISLDNISTRAILFNCTAAVALACGVYAFYRTESPDAPPRRCRNARASRRNSQLTNGSLRSAQSSTRATSTGSPERGSDIDLSTLRARASGDNGGDPSISIHPDHESDEADLIDVAMNELELLLMMHRDTPPVDGHFEGNHMVKLLHQIEMEQRRKNAYVHRGVSCNSCRATPIKGMRYRCTQCVDVDLCEKCEAADTHPRTHILYKVKIPIPVLYNPDWTGKACYPGKEQLFSRLAKHLTRAEIDKYHGMTHFTVEEIEAAYEQFKTLCVLEYRAPGTDHFQGGIDQETLKKVTSRLGAVPNLVTDRIFFIYDSDNNGVVGFEEYITVLSVLTKGTKIERLKCAFRAYDADQDGYVTRRDILNMFSGYFDLSMSLVGYMLQSSEEDTVDWDAIYEQTSLSAVFGSEIPSLTDLPPRGIPDKDHDGPWNIDRDFNNPRRRLSADLYTPGPRELSLLDETEYDAELKKTTMEAIEILVSEIFVAAKPKNPDTGLSWEEFSSLAKNANVYLGILTCMLDPAVF